MNTQKPFSSISYNTLDWLLAQLNQLLQSHDIEFYCLVSHKGEDDEAGLKNHIHLYVEPNSRFKTTILTDMCIEPTPDNPIPLKMMPCRHSEFDDWFKYTSHDEAYLKFKGLGERKYSYSFEQYITSDIDYFRMKVREINLLHVSWYAKMNECIEQGMTFDEFFAQGGIPIQQVRSYESAWTHLWHWHNKDMTKKIAIAKAKRKS